MHTKSHASDSGVGVAEWIEHQAGDQQENKVDDAEPHADEHYGNLALVGRVVNVLPEFVGHLVEQRVAVLVHTLKRH